MEASKKNCGTRGESFSLSRSDVSGFGSRPAANSLFSAVFFFFLAFFFQWPQMSSATKNTEYLVGLLNLITPPPPHHYRSQKIAFDREFRYTKFIRPYDGAVLT